ncbi:MAG: quinolinate synthase NadA [Alphaproteobacteria bacterium]|nr:quinolinate synthase NadA [Alphaproteobacteria bacterium]
MNPPLLTEKDIDPDLDLEAEIKRLRVEMNAVILAHYYQDSEIQDLADFVGDSLDLSRRAKETDADVIVFCGVRFMAEVATIFNPGKPVLLPDLKAGCSLEDSCPPEQFAAFKAKHPGHLVMSYINCSAEVKAQSDIIVTSTNAEALLRQIPESQPIIFAPDRYLGGYLKRKTGRDMVLWNGSCIVHEQFSERGLSQLMTQYPDAWVIAHPECPEALLGHADHIGSTSSLVNFTAKHPGETFIVLTEPGIIHQMEKASPGSTFYGAPGADGCVSCNNCSFMKLNTLEKLYLCMVNKSPRLELPRDLAEKARLPLERMLDMSAVVA